ncbi:SPL family radical SAM protein [Thermodesulfobacterium hydrogeniphilum]|uniref:SPL family radical SAM protein n=1 Tax=Thermodesulfobacterium hydrogeniphilum TaxID=161156 RepID=UPI00056DC8DA|nr:radical SAM protein [Thermodesulfobacterium hydrogeniphilum]
MKYIQPFDPWKSSLCTCPPKYSLNPYTGCGHGCLYCYATSFIKNFYSPRPKKDFLKIVIKDLVKLPKNSLISLSNSSDPYQPLENLYEHTKKFLNFLLGTSYRVLIITKSDLILRDIKLLTKLRCAVSITITSKTLSKKLEPGAPGYKNRLKAVKILSEAGIPVSVRLDPIIPGLNEKEIFEILDEIVPYVKHITVSTYKARPDSLKRLINAFPEKKKLLEELYLEKGKRLSGAIYLPDKLRYKLIKPLYEKAKKYNLSFATCREALDKFKNPGKCDGSFLII